ncbi:DUF3800 domain-containing protein [Methylobacterium thuringiense]|uniref:DUF3800 domain-containing protein n=1 Tax=Methylobacterium thuringiense TaxID=1003091 RepID=A0ABQ4TU21_9HYPH|nr:hypothetical protein EKPJFOCH_3904 [Methylobacterium thuringiense]
MLVPAPPNQLPSLSFYGDASSKQCAFMVAGGFAVSGNRINEVEDSIAAIRDDAGIRSEFHWSQYRGGNRRSAYESLIQYGFDLIKTRKAALHVIIAKFDGYNHREKAGDDRDTSVNRMYYQLFLHRLAAFYGRARRIHIRLDAGNDCKDICRMRNELCADAYKRHQTKPNCIVSIEPVKSENVGIIQLTDVVLGAIAAKQNAVAHTSPKKDLADFALRVSGRHSWASDTAPSARFLTVWHLKSRSRSP